MKLHIEFEIDNAAFHNEQGELEEHVEAARILRYWATKLEENGMSYLDNHHIICDLNGNKIGRIEEWL